jgi:hypothetical protein
MKYLLLLTIGIVAGSAYLFFTRTAVVDSSLHPMNTEEVELRQLLKQMGNRYDCYFTMEIVPTSASNAYSLETVRLPEGQGPFLSGLEGKSLQEGLEWLKESVPNLSYSFADRAKVVHVVDVRLTQQGGYAMDTVVGNLNFEGPLSELPNALGKKGVRVSSKNFGDTRELGIIDQSTTVKVSEKNKKVRDILTNSLDLQKRGRVLWIAETGLEVEKTTYIRYILKAFS